MNCPKCGSEVDNMPGCHTYGGPGGWFSCMDCGSATVWYCTNLDECDWMWTQGLNPRNPRSVENDLQAPPWADTLG